MDDPLAFFLTWNTYGTWLPGDARGWVEYRSGWRMPDPILELECSALMTDDACRLNRDQRAAVEAQIAETCRMRRWHLHAVNCRSNHVHVVVSAPATNPGKVRVDLKAWATRCLKRQFDPSRDNWWVERGSIRHLYTEAAFESAVEYVLDGQDRKTETIRTVRRSRMDL